MAEHDRIFVNGEEQPKKNKVKLPPEFDWEAEAKRVNRAIDKAMQEDLTEEQKKKLKTDRHL